MAFVPPVLDVPRSAVVESVEPYGGIDYLVFFDSITTKTDAEQLVGCTCLVRKDELEALQAAALEENLEGFAVVDARYGAVGTSLGLEELPGQVLLSVQRADGGEVLIPFVDEFIQDIDEEERCIYTSVPVGLLEMGD